MTYIRPPLKHQNFSSRPLTISKCADSLCGLIFEAGEEFVELCYSEGFEEPFATRMLSDVLGKVDGDQDGGL